METRRTNVVFYPLNTSNTTTNSRVFKQERPSGEKKTAGDKSPCRRCKPDAWREDGRTKDPDIQMRYKEERGNDKATRDNASQGKTSRLSEKERKKVKTENTT
jgi:hypothetical protein